jgi:hypothetical protein
MGGITPTLMGIVGTIFCIRRVAIGPSKNTVAKIVLGYIKLKL